MRLRLGAFQLDVNNACLWREDERLELRPKTFEVLMCLVNRAGDLVTSEELLDEVWPDTAVADSVLRVSMSELRKALSESAKEPQYIVTVHRRGYRFIAPVEPLDPSASESPPLNVMSSTLLVDRDRDLARLLQHLEIARSGQRQILFISGEAGMGKTALVDAFIDQVMEAHAIDVSRGQCIDHYGAGEAYMPLLEALSLLLREHRGPDVMAQLKQHAPSWLFQLPAFVPDSEFDMLQRRVSGATRERMLRELAECIEMLTVERPLVLVLEDLHWSDISTLDWLTYVARRRQPARLFIVGTYRPGEAAMREHPVRDVSQDLMVHGQAAEHVLDYLSESGVTAYLRQRLASTTVPLAFGQKLHQRTNGNPLFVRTIVDEFEFQGLLPSDLQDKIQWEDIIDHDLKVPSGIQYLITQQVEQLSRNEQDVLEAASVAGKEFAAAVVAVCVSRDAEDIENQCGRWARLGQFVRSGGVERWPDGTVSERFAFTHDLYREALYERLAAGQRQRFHLQIGLRFESGYGEEARHHAAALSEHFRRGLDVERAVTYLEQAANTAQRRAAFTEVLQHTAAALELLESAPETPDRIACELRMQVTRGQVLMMTQGYASAVAEQACRRAHELSAYIVDPTQQFQVLQGLANFYIVRADHQTSRHLGEQLLELAERQQDSILLYTGHFTLGIASYFLGSLEAARTHWQQSLAFYDPHQPGIIGVDVRMFCHSFLPHVLSHLGFGDQALLLCHEALALARELPGQFDLAVALGYAAMLHQFRRDSEGVKTCATDLIELCQEQAFAYYGAWGTFLVGWVQTGQGQSNAGIEQMRQGVEDLQRTGGEARFPYYLSLLAEALGNMGQAVEGLRLLDQALAQAHDKDERWYESEIYRLKGELLRQSGELDMQTGVEACFHRALDIAREQCAKTWELRAATSLSRLWQQQGKRREAMELLAPVYNGFTEGFELADLQDARRLLGSLG